MVKILRYFFFILLIMGSQCGYAQTERLTQFWNEYAFTKDLSQKWVVELDAGLTSSGVPHDNNMFHGLTQFYFRGWAHYYPANRWKISFFYAHYFNENVPELDQNKAPEYRFAFQTTYNLFKHRRIKVNLRARVEDRNIKTEEGIYEAVERFRFQVRSVYPINKPEIVENTIYLFLSDELFFKTKSDISGSEFFDRNRATLGFGYSPTKDIQFEISYANEALPRQGTNKVYDAVQVSLIFNNLFTNAIKPFTRKKTEVDDGISTGGG